MPNATNTDITKFAYNYQIAGSEDIPVKARRCAWNSNRSEKARMWFKVSGFSSNNTGRTSPAISNQWGLADVGYAQTMPQLGGNFTYIFTPSLINETTVGMNLWTEAQKAERCGTESLPARYLRDQHCAELSEGQPARPVALDVVWRREQPGAS